MELHPWLEELLREEAELVTQAGQRLNALRMLRGSRALFAVGSAILQRYDRLKRSRGLVDFNDLIVAAANLLTRAEIRNWVQYKLDRGIDHVLIDEAQDTSARQWEIVNALVAEFFAGQGSDRGHRTVFAVGDEKQSIYSFQGADPEQFSTQLHALKKRASDAGQIFRDISLQLSFRSTPDILDAVDQVFRDPDTARGLSSSEKSTVHEALRRRDPGEVQIWPLIGKERTAETSSWIAPVDAPEANDPAIALAQRIAATIAGWIGNREKLPGRERPIRCGDILILVRRRDRFATAVTRELKLAGLAIAGADRLYLTEHIAVEDLMAIGRFVLMPEDDLSLAAALKSPVFGFDDEDLIAIASARGGVPLFAHMKQLAGQGGFHLHPKLDAAVGLLDRLRRLAATVRPYEFFAHILSAEGGRRAFLSRLGTEAEDVLDAFLQAVLAHERAGGKTLESFLSALSLSAPEIKREVDMQRDEIRVITVHAAKGLEAPIVFLVDPCTPAYNRQHRPQIVRVETPDARSGYLWQPDSKSGIALTEARYQAIEAEAEAEYRRLLYVGMTRAADRLVICGWHGINAPKPVHWHAMIMRQLAESATEMADAQGESYLLWQSPKHEVRSNARERPLSADDSAIGDPATAEPEWLRQDAPYEPPLPRPLTPSDAGRWLSGGQSRPAQSEAVGQADSALVRGTATHRLLQILPELPQTDREAAARNWLSKHASGLDAQLREEIARETMSVINDQKLRALFAAGSQAETAIVGEIGLEGRSITVSGQIDRLLVTPDEIIIADYKTNREAPQTEQDVPESYVLQLALYRQLLRRIYPGRSVRCWLIWTQNGQLNEISTAAMEQAMGLMRIAAKEDNTFR